MRFFPRGILACASVAFAFGCARAEPAPDVIFAWAAGADSSAADFLAVIDVTPGSEAAGQVLARVEVPGRRNGPHHSEHELFGDGRLFVNGFASGQSWVFDVSTPTAPRIVTQFGDMGGYSHPHSFIRLPNGNVLGVFQMQHLESGMRPGGLVELTPDGALVRASAPQPDSIPAAHRVYSGLVVEALDRIVTTSTDMDDGGAESRRIQVWRLSDLSLLHTLSLPDGPLGDEALYTAEPRLMADGRTVLVSTFNCGLYLLDGLDGDRPSGRLVSTFPRRDDTSCAIPYIVGRYYLVTVPAYSAVVALDISDPAAPREVSRVAFDSTDVPHWISVSPDGRRVVVTGYATMRRRVELLDFDPESGRLSRALTVPDVGGVPHGTVFGRR
jgi:hypothetical protein